MSKIKSFLEGNIKYLFLVLVLVVINFLFIIEMKYNDNKIGILCLLCLAAVQMIIMGIACIYLKNHVNEKKENLFLKLFIPISILYFIFLPVFCVPDEINHFLRAYEISDGHLISKEYNISKNNKAGNKLDKNLSKITVVSTKYSDLLKLFKYNSSNKKKVYLFGNTSLYSFVCYLPQTFGILIGKIIRAPLLVQAYLGRLFNLIVFTILGYFTIKFIPFKKISAFLILFSPIVMQEAISLSPDALTIASSSLLIAYILHLKYNCDSKLNRSQIVLLSLLSVVLSLCKIVYFPICMLLFIIPFKRFGTKKKKNIIIISIIIISMILNLIWLSISSSFLPDSTSGANSSLQLSYILHNLHQYIYIIFNTYDKYLFYYLETGFGRILGLFSIILSELYVIPYIIIFIITCLFDNKKDNKKLEKYNYFLLIFIIISVIMLITTSLYLQWNPVGNKVIDGIQGRYYIPILFIFPFLFNNLSIKINEKKELNLFNKYILLFIVSYNVYALLSILYIYI